MGVLAGGLMVRPLTVNQDDAGSNPALPAKEIMRVWCLTAA